MLVGIVERYDTVKCWMGELIYVPEKWAPFDVVFLYCLPALPFKLVEVFRVLASRCAPGLSETPSRFVRGKCVHLDPLRPCFERDYTGLISARVVISHVEGRQGLEQQKQQFGDVIMADLPDKTTLEKVAADHSFVTTEFTNDPTFYLAMLEMKG